MRKISGGHHVREVVWLMEGHKEEGKVVWTMDQKFGTLDMDE